MNRESWLASWWLSSSKFVSRKQVLDPQVLYEPSEHRQSANYVHRLDLRIGYSRCDIAALRGCVSGRVHWARSRSWCDWHGSLYVSYLFLRSWTSGSFSLRDGTYLKWDMEYPLTPKAFVCLCHFGAKHCVSTSYLFLGYVLFEKTAARLYPQQYAFAFRTDAGPTPKNDAIVYGNTNSRPAKKKSFGTKVYILLRKQYKWCKPRPTMCDSRGIECEKPQKF